jgi:hypothetical protein
MIDLPKVRPTASAAPSVRTPSVDRTSSGRCAGASGSCSAISGRSLRAGFDDVLRGEEVEVLGPEGNDAGRAARRRPPGRRRPRCRRCRDAHPRRRPRPRVPRGQGRHVLGPSAADAGLPAVSTTGSRTRRRWSGRLQHWSSRPDRALDPARHGDAGRHRRCRPASTRAVR